jgi:1,4-alpha-glucan branching enzyme
VLAFHRWRDGGPGDDVVVVLNCSSQVIDRYRIGLPRPGAWRVRLNSDWSGYSDDFGAVHSADPFAGESGVAGMASAADVALGPYAALILSQDR